MQIPTSLLSQLPPGAATRYTAVTLPSADVVNVSKEAELSDTSRTHDENVVAVERRDIEPGIVAVCDS